MIYLRTQICHHFQTHSSALQDGQRSGHHRLLPPIRGAALLSVSVRWRRIDQVQRRPVPSQDGHGVRGCGAIYRPLSRLLGPLSRVPDRHHEPIDPAHFHQGSAHSTFGPARRPGPRTRSSSSIYRVIIILHQRQHQNQQQQ